MDLMWLALVGVLWAALGGMVAGLRRLKAGSGSRP